MKIRTKLTLRYTCVTAVVFSLFVLTVYLVSEKNREKEFYRTLFSEAITKTNLFLSGRVNAETMHSIYLNNREFIDEVEVAIYNTNFELLYHDAKDIDLVKETPELIEKIIKEQSVTFYENQYQVTGLLYDYEGKEYVITAAAYDGYGYKKQEALTRILILLWIVSLALLAIIGYLLAKAALAPVSDIVNKVEQITETNLDTRLPIQDKLDELGELSGTFNQMLDRLEKSFDSQKMFVSNISHELRTPLAALITELEIALLREERSEQEYREIITNALEDARRLKRLSTGLLDLARANYDPTQIVMEEIRLDELLLDARELIIKANNNYCVELIFDQEAENDSLITVYGNLYLLRTAFVNLIENNCKYSKDKTSYVNISFHANNSIVRFSDTGIGISKQDIQRLFEPFYRGENNSYSSGHGIGLALVHKILQLHKGDIEIHSQQGEGTVFIVQLPHI